MKKKLVILNLSLILAVLFAILFQSVHSFEHLAEEFTHEHCHHKYDISKTEFTHAHHDFDHCFACEFTFSSYLPTEFFSFTFTNTSKTLTQHIAKTEKPIVFSGSFFSLRAPPVFA
ncbi:MAG TPA: hypothetical protein PK776_07260 [Flavobacterium sp.]|nr:hypothetical protein [Flavobacterium sp.]